MTSRCYTPLSQIGLGWRASPADLARDLVAFWPLDEPAGQPRYDRVGPNHLVELGGTVGTAAGTAGNSRSAAFAGVPAVRLQTKRAFAHAYGMWPLTISLWLYTNTSGILRVFSKRDNPSTGGDEMALLINTPTGGTAGFYAITTAGNPTAISQAFSTGMWNHLFCTLDPRTSLTSIRLNALSVVSVTWGASVSLIERYNNSFALGSSSGDNGQSTYGLDGRVQNVAIWKRLLTNDEQLAVYNLGLAGRRWFHQAQSPDVLRRFWMFPPVIERTLVQPPVAGVIGRISALAPASGHIGTSPRPNAPLSGQVGPLERSTS